MENEILTRDKKKYASYRKKKIFNSVWMNTLVAVLAIIWILPILYIILRSFDANTKLDSPSLIPTSWTLDNYINLFNDSDAPYARWVVNTLILALLNCVLTTFFTLVTAFALSRFRFKSRKKLMNISLILGMFPGFMSMTAIYLILDILGKFIGYYLNGEIISLLMIYVCGAGMGYFVSKGYFDTIPTSLEEAAIIDGANMFTVFFKIFLPIAKPIIIYTALTAFMAPWSDYVLAGIILGGNTPVENQTVAVGLYNMITNAAEANDKFTVFTAGCVLEAIPIVILYISLQKFMVQGISSGAVKG